MTELWGLQDESWRDSYDRWKLASPDEDEFEECDCEDYEVDALEGRATCNRCGHDWLMTSEELEAYERVRAEATKAWESLVRRERWRDRWLWLRSFFVRRRIPDDDIPF